MLWKLLDALHNGHGHLSHWMSWQHNSVNNSKQAHDLEKPLRKLFLVFEMIYAYLLLEHTTVSVVRAEQFEFDVRLLFGGLTLVFGWVPLQTVSTKM